MIRGLWDRETVALLLLAATLPVAVTWLVIEGPWALARLAFFLLVAGIWHVLFMLARAQPPSFAGALTALALAMLAPEDLGLFPLILGTSFGVVMAELAFGGWGRNILNPATIALAFIGFSFPTTDWPGLAIPVGWAVIPALLLGVALGVISARLLLGVALVCLIAVLAGIALPAKLAIYGVVLLLLVCDPVTSAATALGRVLNGALFGALAIMVSAWWTGAHPVQAAVTAALLTSLAAPLLDEIAIALWLTRRRRRLG